jgi:hypothetical protein
MPAPQHTCIALGAALRCFSSIPAIFPADCRWVQLYQPVANVFLRIPSAAGFFGARPPSATASSASTWAAARTSAATPAPTAGTASCRCWRWRRRRRAWMCTCGFKRRREQERCDLLLVYRTSDFCNYFFWFFTSVPCRSEYIFCTLSLRRVCKRNRRMDGRRLAAWPNEVSPRLSFLPASNDNQPRLVF